MKVTFDESDKPPSNSGKNNPELHILGSRDLLCPVIGCRPVFEGRNNFRNLVILGEYRRNLLLAIDKDK